MRFLTVLAVAALGYGPASATTVSWVDWTSVSGSTVSGTLAVGSETVDVTFTNSVANFGVQSAGGTDFWNPASTYTSNGPDGNVNRPTGTDIIALGTGGTRSLTFSKEIEGLYFSYVSWNGQTSATFSESMMKLSEGPGFWGSGVLTLSGDGRATTGATGEPHGTLFTSAALTSFTFTTSTEFWHGFTVGVAGTSGQVPVDPPPVDVIPLPAAGWLLLAGLGGLAALRRRS